MWKLKTLALVVTVLSLSFVLTACGDKENENSNTNTIDTPSATDIVTGQAGLEMKENLETKTATPKAQELCRAKLLEGEDLSDGPCLSNNLIPGWVADIAHSPRQAVDDLPENQCSAYREGTAKHFVELDTNCDLIRAE